MSLSPEEIEANWKKFRSLISKLGDRSQTALNLVDSLGERLCLCPASSRTQYHNAFPGGLVDHSLRVLGNALKLTNAFDWELPKDSLIIGTLFHDLGKVGNESADYYIQQNDGWRADKLGEEYKHNDELPYMTVPERGVYLCNHFGLKLTHDETLAIRLNDGWILNENKPYCLKEPLLAHVVMTADYIATMQEGGKFP
jgi:hypothetical protein